MYKILNACMATSFKSYKYHITNNFKKLLKEKKDSKNICTITTLILLIFKINIRPCEFLDTNTPEIIFGLDKKISQTSINIKKIFVKLIFSSCVSLDYSHC